MRAAFRWWTLFLGACFCMSTDASAQPDGFNYDEAKVPAYTLPDPLVTAAGTKVATAEQWKTRRAELLALFAEQMFGRTPSQTIPIRAEVLEESKDAMGGLAIRRQTRLHIGTDPHGPKLDLLIYLPAAAKGPVPIFLGPNFDGNQSINADPDIRLADCWLANNPDKGIAKNRATEKSRGIAASRWEVERILKRGYGTATFCYCDIDPDFDDGFKNGIHPLFYKPGQTKPEANEWGSIGAWAWGLSRALDYLETSPQIDAKRVILHGHSRLGKTALWAGANDERFAIVISNNSGEGGAAITRRRFGETLKRINTSFPHWFCGNYKQYNDREEAVPFDAHELIAIIAPRPVYVASAEEDRWADPRGEFLAAYHAGPVYRLLGKEPLSSDKMPAVNEPVQTTVGYHIRSGKHDVTPYDWDRYLDFAEKHFKQ